MKKYFSKILCLSFCAILLSMIMAGQVAVYNSAALTLSAGVTATVDGNLTNQINGTSGTVNNQGTFDLKINLTNNTSNSLFITNAGLVRFSGSASQIVNGTNPISFYNVTANKASNHVTLNNSNNRISNTLTLTNGKIILGANTLIMDINSAVAGSPGINSYVQADGAGVLQKNYTTTGTFNYPIGDVDDYSPFSLTLNSATFSGTGFVSFNVTDAMHPAMSIPDNITRYWTINSGGITAINYNINYIYTDADVTGTESTIMAAKYNGSHWVAYNYTNPVTNALSSSSGVTEIPFNYFYSGGSLYALPVKLIYFDADIQQTNVLLKWETVSDGNLRYFSLERSINGVDFSEIAQIQRSGSFNNSRRYTHYDNPPENQTIYYRLKQINEDESSSYSKTITVQLNNRDNTFKGRFSSESRTVFLSKASTENKTVSISLHNLTGQLYFRKVLITNTQSLNQQIQLNENLTRGIYFITLYDGAKKFTEKIFVR